MMIKKHLLIVSLLFAGIPKLTAAMQQSVKPPWATFYVAPDGIDTNAGTEAAPFATIDRARDALRPMIAGGLTNDATILIRGGTYELSGPLIFGPQDSGTEKCSVTYAAYPGERVIISGGRRIAGWKRGEGKLWTTQVPEVKEGRWYFHQLFVGGQRASRARLPRLDDKTPYYRITGSTFSDDLKQWTLALSTGQVANWKNASDIEIVVLEVWEIARLRLESANETNTVVTVAPPNIPGYSLCRPEKTMACYFENAREMLTEAGQWYLDRTTGVLSYWPLPAQDMSSSDIVAPLLNRLVEVKGTADHPILNLHFKSLDFSHTEWEIPKFGYMGAQSCFYQAKEHLEEGAEHDTNQFGRITEGIRFEHTTGCSVEDCEISHFGGSGLALCSGCLSNRLRGISVFDIGGNGLMVGEQKDPTNVSDAIRGNRVANSFIHNCGAVFHGGVGIWVGYTDGTIIDRNLLYDLPYTGISVGWQWNDNPSGCMSNVVERNHIHHAMNLLADGAGVYFLGRQPGSVIKDNLIHDIHKNNQSTPYYNQCGIYLDNGCRDLLVESNVVYRVDKPISMNTSTKEEWNVVVSNFIGAEPNQPGYARAIADKTGPEASFRKIPSTR